MLGRMTWTAPQINRHADLLRERIDGATGF